MQPPDNDWTVAAFIQEELGLTEEELEYWLRYNEDKNFRSINLGPMTKNWSMERAEERDLWRIGPFLFQVRKTEEDEWTLVCMNELFEEGD